MARDYKPRRKPKGAFSGWIGVALGLAAGLAVAGLVYVKDHKPQPQPRSLRRPTKKDRTTPSSRRIRTAPMRPQRTMPALPTISTRTFPSSRWWCRKRRRTCGRTSAPSRRPAGGPTCCRRARTRISPMPTGCAPSSPCRASSRRCRRSRWTTTPGTGSASDRSRTSISSTACAAILRKADVDVLVIRVGD